MIFINYAIEPESIENTVKQTAIRFNEMSREGKCVQTESRFSLLSGA